MNKLPCGCEAGACKCDITPMQYLIKYGFKLAFKKEFRQEVKNQYKELVKK